MQVQTGGDLVAAEAVEGRAGRAAPAARLASLDQFRGYTVVGMFVVNFLGSFAVTPDVLRHHHTYCSYADTIMPQFLFAVGFAFRLTFGRRTHARGLPAAYRRAARRIGGLILVSLVLYTLGGYAPVRTAFNDYGVWAAIVELGKRQWFQTLLHIAVTSLWILPVIRAGTLVRVAYLVVSAAVHVVLSGWFNFVWVNSPPNGIDGGPLGFLTWAIPALVGTLACDAMTAEASGNRTVRLLAWSTLPMVLGYGMSCLTHLYDVPELQTPPPPRLADSPVIPPWDRAAGRPVTSLFAEPPFVPPPGPAQRQWNYWMMSQRSGSLSYLTFAAGFALAVFALFHLACDRAGWQLGLFRTLGTNALAGYVLFGSGETAIKPLLDRTAPWWQVGIGFAACFAATYAILRLMERKGILVRL
jgi:predicted acyltransferase